MVSSDGAASVARADIGPQHSSGPSSGSRRVAALIESRRSCNCAGVAKAKLFGVIALLCAPACGESVTQSEGDETGGEVIDRELCDGSQDLRLAWFRGGGGSVHTELEREVGFYYLYVRGDCRYWALTFQKPPEVAVFETRTGVLDADAEAALAELVRYGEWADLVGYYDEEGAFDVTWTFVHDGTELIVCRGDCPTAPESVIDIQLSANTTFHELWTAGEPLADDAPMRIVAMDLGPDYIPGGFDEVFEWTIDLDLATVAVSYEQLMMSGVSTLIDDPELASALREFRAAHPEPVSRFDNNLIVETPSGAYYNVFMRDAVPFENEQGLIAKPPLAE